MKLHFLVLAVSVKNTYSITHIVQIKINFLCFNFSAVIIVICFVVVYVLADLISHQS